MRTLIAKARVHKLTPEGVEKTVVADVLFKMNWLWGKYEMQIKNGETYDLLEGAQQTRDFNYEGTKGLIVDYISNKHGIFIEPQEDFEMVNGDPTYNNLQLIACAVQMQTRPKKAKSSSGEFSTFYLGREAATA